MRFDIKGTVSIIFLLLVLAVSVNSYAGLRIEPLDKIKQFADSMSPSMQSSSLYKPYYAGMKGEYSADSVCGHSSAIRNSKSILSQKILSAEIDGDTAAKEDAESRLATINEQERMCN